MDGISEIRSKQEHFYICAALCQNRLFFCGITIVVDLVTILRGCSACRSTYSETTVESCKIVVATATLPIMSLSFAGCKSASMRSTLQAVKQRSNPG